MKTYGMLYRLLSKVPLPKKSRSVLPPTPVLPAYAAAELSAVFGGVAISGAVLYGLAMMIRDANGFDAKDQALNVERVGLETVAAAAPPAEVLTAIEDVIDEDDVKQKETDISNISARVQEARSWISQWKRRAEEEMERIQKEAAEAKEKEKIAQAEMLAKEAEERALAAQKKVEEKEAEIAAAMAAAESEVEKRSAKARQWIDTWKQKTSSLAADPVRAAAVIKEMTEDTPVGVKKPSTPEPVLVTGGTEQNEATEWQASPVRRVSITSEYESKIKSLIADYESSKQKRQAMMMPKQTVTVAEEELAAAEQEQATRKTSPVILFFLRVIAMIQACFEFVKSFFTSHQGPQATAT